MITLAYYWKRELVRLADRLEKRQYQRRWTCRSEASLEKQVFVGAYAVRKLIDSGKVSPRLLSDSVVIIRYPVREKEQLGDPVHHFVQRFEIPHGTPHELTVRELMNQFIHSYYFSSFVPAGGQMMGIFVASADVRKRWLYYVTLPAFSAILRKIGSEAVSRQELDDLLAEAD